MLRTRKLPRISVALLCAILTVLPSSFVVATATSTTDAQDRLLGASQVIQSESPQVSIIYNGGFEEGLKGWKATNFFLTSSGNGYPSISTSSVHSGSAAVALNFLSSTFGGNNVQSMELIGIYQAVNVSMLNGLHVHGWFSMRQTVSAVAARMSVQVGSLEASYYVAYDSEQRLRYYDTAGSRSVFVYQVGQGQNG